MLQLSCEVGQIGTQQLAKCHPWVSADGEFEHRLGKSWSAILALILIYTASQFFREPFSCNNVNTFGNRNNICEIAIEGLMI